jgi:hypothetical protein
MGSNQTDDDSGLTLLGWIDTNEVQVVLWDEILGRRIR